MAVALVEPDPRQGVSRGRQPTVSTHPSHPFLYRNCSGRSHGYSGCRVPRTGTPTASVTTCELRPNGGVVINETNFVERGGRGWSGSSGSTRALRPTRVPGAAPP